MVLVHCADLNCLSVMLIVYYVTSGAGFSDTS